MSPRAHQWILQLCFLAVLVASGVATAADDPLSTYYVVPDRPAFAKFQDPLALLPLAFVEVPSIDLLNFQFQARPFPVPAQPYDRLAHFGSWVNDRRDTTCFDTRAKVLIRDSIRPVTYSPRNRCVVAGGEWREPYAGHVVNSAADIQIDHVVALKNAYMTGAHRWDFRSRCLYANFVGNDFHLLPVDKSENMRKGDKSPADWMPSDFHDHCAHLMNWVRVKVIWGLVFAPRETAAIGALVRRAGCDPNWFKMPAAALAQQRDFIRRNIDLCDHVSGGFEQ